MVLQKLREHCSDIFVTRIHNYGGANTFRLINGLNRKGSFHNLKTCLYKPHLIRGKYSITRRKLLEITEKYEKIHDLVIKSSIAKISVNLNADCVYFSLETTSHCLRNN